MDPDKYRPRDLFNAPYTTTLAGAPVEDTMRALSVGPRGPVLLEDFHHLEKLANFDRERIPERVVHARGATARGTFTCTRSLRDVTSAALFSAPGVATPVAVRFSTVVHSRHSPETLRDPRGFAVKFYTPQGNWDLVGNNMPVFFVRQSIAFPDMVHAFKPSPRTERQEWARILDFLSFHPESLHMLTFLLDDVGVPRDYAHMPGFGVHTFVFVNADARRTYVKFHWVPEQPVECLQTKAEEVRVGGADFSHATHALIDDIDAGRFPAWRLCVQLMDPATELQHAWGDPLDPSKTWPEDEFPLVEVGRMVLDRNVDNQFLENEQIAFSPAVVVPGITYSADKLLQGRLFSYADTQRYRLGANYLQLPVNAPRCPLFNAHYDGALNHMHRRGDVNYFPSTRTGTRHANGAETGSRDGKTNGYHLHDGEKGMVVQGVSAREEIPKENNFQQPGERWRSFDKERQARFVDRVAETLNENGVTKELKATWLGYWTKCDRTLGARLAERVKMSNM